MTDCFGQGFIKIHEIMSEPWYTSESLRELFQLTFQGPTLVLVNQKLCDSAQAASIDACVER